MNFIPAQFVGNVDPPPSPLYTGGQATNAAADIIDQFTLNNVTASVVVVKVYMDGTDISQLTLQVSIPANQSYLCGEIVGHDLNAGQPIYISADTAMAVSVRMGGRGR